jgi:hypothetical protein
MKTSVNLVISIGWGALVTVVLVFFRIALSDYPFMGHVADAAVWPLTLLVRLFPAPRLLPGGGREGTPIQLIAAVVGLGMTWVFYSFLFFLLGRFRGRNIESHDC